MKEKYLSIITNFGCHYTCPYCIVKNSNIQVPKTTENGLSKLRETIIYNNINIVSVSGGGDPLHEFEKHKEWYEKLFTILREVNIPLEVHTSYIENDFNTDNAIRMVYHLQSKSQLEKVKRKGGERVRVVFVVTDDMTEKDILEIANFVSKSQDIDELSFRQLVRSDYTVSNHLHELLLNGHKILWYYIEQNDYNLYYAENFTYTKYSEIGKNAPMNFENRAVIGGCRTCNKTTELIKLASRKNLYIITSNYNKAHNLASYAKSLGYDIHFPVTIYEVLKTGGLHSPFIEWVLIDDIEEVLSEIIKKPIFTMSTSYNLIPLEPLKIKEGGVIK